MHRSHPLAKLPALTYDDLDGQTIISKGRAYDCFRHHIDKYFLAPGRKIHILAETADESIIRTLLLHNKAINIGYDYADPLYPHPDIVSRTLKEEISGQMIYLVSNPQVRKTKAACLFRDYLLEWMKKKRPYDSAIDGQRVKREKISPKSGPKNGREVGLSANKKTLVTM